MPSEKIKIIVRKPDCPCRWKNCKRHGDCEACREHHKTVKKGMPVACDRKEQAKTKKGLP